MSIAVAAPRTTFALPRELEADAPPEARGVSRDAVRLLVARRERIEHAVFSDLKRFLFPGDLVVVNTSATLPAALDGIRPDGGPVTVHLSSPLGDDVWVVELRASDGPLWDVAAGEVVHVIGGARIDVLAAHPHPEARRSRLWRASVEVDGPVERYLARYGRPVTYGYLRASWPLSAYQTIFATHTGSAEMPSAGRPFTHELVTELIVRGINIAPILLHAGVSSLESGEPPQDEPYDVPAATAWLVNETREAGRRVIAVGTTVTRALETVARRDGSILAGRGRTDLILDRDRPARVVDGLITGWHPPAASHLALLEAVAGEQLVQRAYDAAIGTGYLWHEFGDSCLLLRR